MPQQRIFVILYADDIMLIAPSILEIEKTSACLRKK